MLNLTLGLGVGGRRGCQGVAEVGPPRQTVVLCGMGLGRGRRLVALNAGGRRDMELGRGVAEGGGLQKEGSPPKKLQGSISQNMPPQLLAQRGHQSQDQDGCSGCSATPAATSTGCNP